MLATTGVLLVGLAVICMAFEAIGSAALIGALGIWMISHAG
jgi:hypothetical protein